MLQLIRASRRGRGYLRMLGAVSLIVCPAWAFAQSQGELPAPFETPSAKAGYGIGRQIGRDLARGGFDGETLDLKCLLMGIQDSLQSKESQVTQEQFQAALLHVQQVAQQKMQQKMALVAVKNREDGPKFLAKYKAVKGVMSTESGMLYQVTKTGTGATPTATDIVKTHYRGRLTDGTEFDSSYKRNEPAEFAVNQVIPGWTEALQKMKVGDRWQIVLPPELAYGEEGSPPVIGPHAVLIFDIELLEIVSAGAPAESQ
jgi:FKBP-type peptidyl-prolyl cis-trans isomerase